MPTDVTLEIRLSQVEQELEQIKQQLEAFPHGKINTGKINTKNAWLAQVIGSVTNDAAFLEAMEYGRAFRQSEMIHDSEGRA
jgi:hypothetical protein